MYRHGRGWRRSFGWPIPMAIEVNGCGDGERGSRGGGGFFGPDGIFGPRGPFGPDGPFGPNGPLGPNGDREAWNRRVGGEHRRRRGRMFGQGELRLVLLRLIADEPRHGYELIKAIEDVTAGSYAPSPGTVYPTLSLLEDEGAIREVAGGDEPRKAFEATEQGRAELAERKEEADGLMARLSEHGERHAERGKAFATPEMFRALGNLAQVVKMKARGGKLDDQALAQVVDLIDEMARKIERL